MLWLFPFSVLLKIRETNMYRGPSSTPYKLEFSPDNLLRCWEECKLKSDYSARCKAVDQFNQQNHWKKRGISIIPIKYGIGFAESFLNQVRWGASCCFHSLGLRFHQHAPMCSTGRSSGPYLQGRFCSGHSWRDRNGTRNPHENAAGGNF